MACFVPKNAPLTCTSIWRSQSSSLVSSTVVRNVTPAEWTSMSSRPYRSMVCVMTLFHAASSVTSRWRYVASPPDARIEAADCSPRSSFRSVRTTLAPSRANRRAALPPRPLSCPSTPEAAPVMRATLPTTRISVSPPLPVADRHAAHHAPVNGTGVREGARLGERQCIPEPSGALAVPDQPGASEARPIVFM